MYPIVKLLGKSLVDIEIPLGDGSTFCFCLDKQELEEFMNKLVEVYEEMED